MFGSCNGPGSGLLCLALKHLCSICSEAAKLWNVFQFIVHMFDFQFSIRNSSFLWLWFVNENENILDFIHAPYHGRNVFFLRMKWSKWNDMIWTPHVIWYYGQVDNSCRPIFFYYKKMQNNTFMFQSCIVNNWHSGITLVDVSFQVAAFLSDNQIHYKRQTVFLHGTQACPILLCRSSGRAWNCLQTLKNLTRHRKPQAPLDYVHICPWLK